MNGAISRRLHTFKEGGSHPLELNAPNRRIKTARSCAHNFAFIYPKIFPDDFESNSKRHTQRERYREREKESGFNTQRDPHVRNLCPFDSSCVKLLIRDYIAFAFGCRFKNFINN